MRNYIKAFLESDINFLEMILVMGLFGHLINVSELIILPWHPIAKFGFENCGRCKTCDPFLRIKGTISLGVGNHEGMLGKGVKG
jgi:hypothetical protein